jgi:hypothetical protein
MSKRVFVTWFGTSQHYRNQIHDRGVANKNAVMKKIVSLLLILQGLIGLNAIGQKNISGIDTSVRANAVDTGDQVRGHSICRVGLEKTLVGRSLSKGMGCSCFVSRFTYFFF